MPLLDVLEFLDNSGRTMVKRLPEDERLEIKWGAQLTVRESQKAIFVKDGKIADIFEPGRYVLETKNIPILTDLLTWPVYGSDSPFRAEVYFINLKLIPNLKWGTQRQILLTDTTFERIRLGANGIFSIQIDNPKLFLNHLVGTQGIYTDSDISDYLRSIIASKLHTVFSSSFDTILNLPKKIEEIEQQIKNHLSDDFKKLGIALFDFHISSFIIPPEVEKAIDANAGIKAISDLNNFLKYKLAESIKIAAENNSSISDGLGAGIGIGAGMKMTDYFKDNIQPPTTTNENSYTKLIKLHELFEKGILTKEEYEMKKEQVLKEI